MAVELASAYVSLIPSFDGVKGRLDEGLGGPAKQAGERAGERAGKAFGQQFGDKAKDLAAKELDLEPVAKREGDRAGTSFGRSFGDKAKDLAGKGGLAASAALAVGFAKDLSIDAGKDKLAAQLGLTAQDAKTAGGIASRLYVGAFGESLGEVNNAVASVMSGLGRFSDTKDIEGLTAKALGFASAFDVDVNDAVGNAAILLETGLAKSGDHAFDLLVAGTQKVPVAFRDELSAATEEYSQFFAGFGFSGEQAMGVLVEASKGGKYLIDKTGDSVKEFANKLRDGNKETSDTLAKLFGGANVNEKGFDKLIAQVDRYKAALDKAQKMPPGAERTQAIAEASKGLASAEGNLKLLTAESDKFQGKFKQLTVDLAGGGPKAKAAFGEIATAISQIKDPVEKSRAAIAIFGTPFEDISGDATKMDAVLKNLSTGGLPDVTGAATRMNETLGGNTASQLESFKRRFELATASVGDFVGPIGAAAPAIGGLVVGIEGAGGAASKIGGLFTGAKDAVTGLASGIGSAAKAGGDFARTQGAAAVASARTTATLVAQKVAVVAQAVATKAAAVAQGAFNLVMSLNPVFLIVAAVVAFIAILVLAYTKVEWFRNFVDAAFRLILGAVQAVVGWVRDNWPLLLAIITGPIGLAVLAVVKHWDTIKAAFTAVKDWIFAKVGDIVGFITGIPGRIGGVVSTMWNGIKNAFTAVKDWIGARIGDYVGFVTNIRDKIAGVARGIFNPLGDAFRAVVNWIIGAWNRLDFGIHIRIPDFIPGVGGRGFDVDDIFPDVPSLGAGGIVPATPGGRIVRVSEAGRDEMITPLPRGGGRGPGRGGDTWNISTPATDPLTAARALADEQDWRRKTSGA